MQILADPIIAPVLQKAVICIIKGIIFDLFGTLVNNDYLYRPVCDWMSSSSDRTAEELEQVFISLRRVHFEDYHEKPFALESFYYLRIFRDMVSQGLVEGDSEELLKVMYESFKKMPVYDDVGEIRQFLDDYPVCIMTNADNAFAYPVVLENGIPHDVLITSEDAQSYKPSRTIFELAADSMRLGREELVVIGDSLKCDFLGPKKAGMKAILIDRKNAHGDLSPRVRSLEEINSILPRI